VLLLDGVDYIDLLMLEQFQYQHCHDLAESVSGALPSVLLGTLKPRHTALMLRIYTVIPSASMWRDSIMLLAGARSLACAPASLPFGTFPGVVEEFVFMLWRQTLAWVE
jgi:hypothetical protein